MMPEVNRLLLQNETERLLAGMVEEEKNRADMVAAQRDELRALLREIYGVLTSDDVTINCRTTSAAHKIAHKIADWVGRSDVFVGNPFGIKKKFSARVSRRTEVLNV